MYKPYRTKHRSASAFTLVELLCSVVVIGVLTGIALPNYIGASNKAKQACVINNMHQVQTAVEAWAVANGGIYPPMIDTELQSYFPGGGGDGITPAPGGPTNPFSSIKEWPVLGSVADVGLERLKAPTDIIAAGCSEYSPIANVYGSIDTYAVRGGGYGGQVIASPHGTLVLSNQ